MARSGCVVGWDKDNAVKGAQNMVPIVCKTRIAALEGLVYKLSLGRELSIQEALEIESIIGKIEWE